MKTTERKLTACATPNLFSRAMKFNSTQTFDLVITDLRLSGTVGTEGFELISRIKTQTPETPVVLFTAYGSLEIEREAMNRGADDYWEKTIQIPTLVEKVRALGMLVGRE
jgi:DNA-binding NtrC family response regulator